MDTDLVLDLFRHTTAEEEGSSSKKVIDQQHATTGPHKNILSGLEDLPTEDEYQELDLSSYLTSLRR
jgi:TATA-binding protein-associated factor